MTVPPDDSELSESLFADWISVAVDDAGPWLRRVDVVPGPIALRARWHYLIALPNTPALRKHHGVDRDRWEGEIALETRGDRALVLDDLTEASKAFAQLRDEASHPLVVVQAHIGLGDTARQDDDMETAQEEYETALALADEIGFSFGAVRARLPLAYIVRRSGSAEEMLKIAEECEASARALGDRAMIANAQVAEGEALDLLRRFDESRGLLIRALSAFRDLKSNTGVAGAGIRLLDAHRRVEDAQSILDLAPEVLTAATAERQLQESVDIHDIVAYAHMRLDDPVRGLASCVAGLEVAGDRYPRGSAHLRMSEGVALRQLGHPKEAAASLLAAWEYFMGRPEDAWTVAYIFGHLAQCAEDLGSPAEAVELQLRAMESLETIRSAQRLPRWQQEYRHRFDSVYRGALLTCIRAGDADAAVAVFESLWGRRLPGIAQGVGLDADADPVLIAQLLARNDQARRGGSPTEEDGSKKVARGLGRVALGGALPQMYADATDHALAAAYSSLDRREGRQLLRSVRHDAALLVICEVPGAPGRIAWLARRPGGEPSLGTRELDATEMALIDRWSSGWPVDASAHEVTALCGLIPPDLRDLPVGTRWQLIPLERLWALPWSAVPIGDDLLGYRFQVLLCPSLTLAALGGADDASGLGHDDSRVVAVVGPAVIHHDLRAMVSLAGAASSISPETSALCALTKGGVETVVVIAHGRPAHGLGHYLELGEGLVLTPTELLNATPPPSVALLSCWGAHVPGPTTGEPLTIATIALARGSHRILTTISQLADTPAAAALVNDILWKARECSWPAALHWALRRRREDLMEAPLAEWAALAAIGGW